MQVYLDNAATTKIDNNVLGKMMPYLKEKYGNPSSIHSLGQENDLKIAACKKDISSIINSSEDELVFSSSATESNNMMIKGFMRANKDKGNHFLISAIEHSCVLSSARELLDEGFYFDYIPVDKNGIILIDELKKMIKPETIMISVMAVNNEIGSIQPVKKIGEIARENNIVFHSDAVQAVPYLKIDVKKWKVDLLSLSSHKFYGPTGAGLSYIRRGVKIKPLIVGGGQEGGLRSGTYNMPAIVGFTEALKASYQGRDKYLAKTKELRDYFWLELKSKIKNIKLNGGFKNRTPNNLNIMFGGVEGEAVLMDLSFSGVYVSTGSACSAQNLRTSSVIKAIGVDDNYLNSNIRITLGKYNNKKEIDYAIKSIVKTVERLRSFSSVK
jgi:cysteine desulfurase